MASINSVQKGKSGEREFCNKLSELVGYQCVTRNLEQCKKNGGHDLNPVSIEEDEVPDSPVRAVAARLSVFAIEIKRHRSGSDADIQKWWHQTVEQARQIKKAPLLAYRFDRQKWHCMLHTNYFDSDDTRGCVTVDIDLFARFLRDGCDALIK